MMNKCDLRPIPNELKSGLDIFIEILEAKRKVDYEEFRFLIMNLTIEQMEEILDITELTLPFMKEQLESRKRMNEIIEQYKKTGG